MEGQTGDARQPQLDQGVSTESTDIQHVQRITRRRRSKAGSPCGDEDPSEPLQRRNRSGERAKKISKRDNSADEKTSIPRRSSRERLSNGSASKRRMSNRSAAKEARPSAETSDETATNGRRGKRRGKSTGRYRDLEPKEIEMLANAMEAEAHAAVYRVSALTAFTTKPRKKASTKTRVPSPQNEVVSATDEKGASTQSQYDPIQAHDQSQAQEECNREWLSAARSYRPRWFSQTDMKVSEFYNEWYGLHGYNVPTGGISKILRDCLNWRKGWNPSLSGRVNRAKKLAKFIDDTIQITASHTIDEVLEVFDKHQFGASVINLADFLHRLGLLVFEDLMIPLERLENFFKKPVPRTKKEKETRKPVISNASGIKRKRRAEELSTIKPEWFAWLEEKPVNLETAYKKWFGLDRNDDCKGGLCVLWKEDGQLTCKVLRQHNTTWPGYLKSAKQFFDEIRIRYSFVEAHDCEFLVELASAVNTEWDWQTVANNSASIFEGIDQSEGKYTLAYLRGSTRALMPRRWQAVASRLEEEIQKLMNETNQREEVVFGTIERASVLEKNLLETDMAILASNAKDDLDTFPRTEDGRLEAFSDPSSTYVEERAFLFHDPASPSNAPRCWFEATVSDEELSPLPEPPALRPPPKDSQVVYSFHDKSRVYRVDCRNVDRLGAEDIAFVGYLFERSDIAVVSTGLVTKLDPALWNKETIVENHGNDWFHRVRRYKVADTESCQEYREQKGYISMRTRDFVEYIDLCEKHKSKAVPSDFSFSFMTMDKEKEVPAKLDVREDVIYAIDHDLTTGTSELHRDFMGAFKLPQVLPAGEWCMLNALPEKSRQFMGPNLYMAMPGAFTQLHQDGRGTVDSGHVVLSGYNDVIKLQRIPERHKMYVNKMLVRSNTTHAEVPYDGVNGIPHAENQGSQPKWFSTSDIKEWKRMGYQPQLVILGPGEHIHLNKGCLHAFRKAHPRDILDDNDCHKSLRNRIPNSMPEIKYNCTSIAWDWIYQGFTAKGINTENSASLSGALINKRNGYDSLGQTKLCVIRKAQSIVAGIQPKPSLSLLGFTGQPKVHEDNQRSIEICRGLLPCLTYIVNEETKDLERAEEGCKGTYAVSSCGIRFRGVTTIAESADACQRPDLSPTDPYDNDGFNCVQCKIELPNCYFHCLGCDVHLDAEYNLCESCFSRGFFTVDHDPKGLCPSAKFSHLCHVACTSPGSCKRCRKKGAIQCRNCELCTSCSCTCHNTFSWRRRFFEKHELESILQKCLKYAGHSPVEFEKETLCQLEVAGGSPRLAHLAKQRLIKMKGFGGAQTSLSPLGLVKVERISEDEADSNDEKDSEGAKMTSDSDVSPLVQHHVSEDPTLEVEDKATDSLSDVTRQQNPVELSFI